MPVYGLTILSAFALFSACSCVSLANAAEVECHANKSFAVAVKPFDDEPGSEFAITALGKKAAPNKCAFKPAQADFVLGKRGDALWFHSQAGKFLILQRSTGPQGDLVVYDLSTRKTVLDVPADDFAVEGNALGFWERSGEATEKNCPQFAENKANGMSSVLSKRKLFDLSTLKTSDTGQERCDTTQ
jgi:hypothetical protein